MNWYEPVLSGWAIVSKAKCLVIFATDSCHRKRRLINETIYF